MKVIKKFPDVTLDINNNVISGEVVLGEVINIDGGYFTITGVNNIGGDVNEVTSTTPTLPGTPTTATTEYKTKLAILHGYPNPTKLIPGDTLLVDNVDYIVDTVMVNKSMLDIHDVFEDSSAVATYQLDTNAHDLGGTYNGTTTDVTYGEGRFGNSAVFNGDTSKIASGVVLGTTSSLSFWIMLSSNHGISAVEGTDLADNSIQASSTTSWISSSDVAFTDGNNMIPALDTWYHIVIIDTGTAIKAYRDKVEITNTQGTYYTLDEMTFDNIGYEVGVPETNSLDGKIEQFRIFNRVISEDEIDMLHTEVYHDTISTTPTLPGVIVNAHKKSLLVASRGQTPSIPAKGLSGPNSTSTLPTILVSADAITITVNSPVENGDSLYAADAGNISEVLVTNIINNGDNTYTCSHNLSYTPTNVYIKNNVSLHILDEFGEYAELTKESVELSGTDVIERYQDYNFDIASTTIQHFITQKYSGTETSSVQSRFFVSSDSVLDILGDGSCTDTYRYEDNMLNLAGTRNGSGTSRYGEGIFGRGLITRKWDTTGTSFYPLYTNIGTLSFWVRKDDDTQGIIMTKYNATYNNMALHYGTVLTYNGHTTMTIAAPYVVPLKGVTYHLAFIDDGEKIRLYRDKILIATSSTDDRLADLNLNRIGEYDDNRTLIFDGAIDQIRWFNKALTMEELEIVHEETTVL